MRGKKGQNAYPNLLSQIRGKMYLNANTGRGGDRSKVQNLHNAKDAIAEKAKCQSGTLKDALSDTSSGPKKRPERHS